MTQSGRPIRSAAQPTGGIRSTGEGEAEPCPRLGEDAGPQYRTVQEALTNTIKHAGQARAAVTVRYASQAVEIEVLDDGTGDGRGAGTEHGIVGMRERVALFGGELEAGRQEGGGWMLRARLPHAAA